MRIAVGYTLRCLVAKIAGNKVTDEMSTLLTPRQLGCYIFVVYVIIFHFTIYSYVYIFSLLFTLFHLYHHYFIIILIF